MKIHRSFVEAIYLYIKISCGTFSPSLPAGNWTIAFNKSENTIICLSLSLQKVLLKVPDGKGSEIGRGIPRSSGPNGRRGETVAKDSHTVGGR